MIDQLKTPLYHVKAQANAEALENDYVKYYEKGNAAAGIRLRVKLRKLRNDVNRMIAESKAAEAAVKGRKKRRGLLNLED